MIFFVNVDSYTVICCDVLLIDLHTHPVTRGTSVRTGLGGGLCEGCLCVCECGGEAQLGMCCCKLMCIPSGNLA